MHVWKTGTPSVDPAFETALPEVGKNEDQLRKPSKTNQNFFKLGKALRSKTESYPNTSKLAPWTSS